MSSSSESKRLDNHTLMQRRNAALPIGIGQTHEIFVERAKNAELWDLEGRRFIDFAGGIGALNTGHSHPDIIAAVKTQLEKFSHTCFMVVAYESYVALSEKLNHLAPGDFEKKSFLLTTGVEAVENAIKVARAYTKRPGIIAFNGGFHGRTNLALSLTGKVAPYKVDFGPFTSEIYHAQYPTPLHGISVEDALNSIERLLKHEVQASRVAAFILEPVQGEGGFYIAPTEFITGVKKIADEHGILIIADEVQSGAGRTGTWFASEQWPVAPDLITSAKSLAGGYPLSALIGRKEVMDAPIASALGGTYAGNPLSVEASLAVLRIFEKEQLLTRSMELGQRIKNHLLSLAEKHPEIVDVRGQGAMVAFELGQNGNARTPDAKLTKSIANEATKRGLILLPCGVFGNVIRILVPLTVTNDVLDEGLEIISQSLKAALG